MIRRKLLLATAAASLTACITADGTYKMPEFKKLASKGVASATDPHWAPLAELGGIQAALLHARLAKTAIPYDDIAYAYQDVATARDEFQRRDRIAAARDRIDRANQQLEGEKTFVVRMDFTLPKYDFDKGGFPTAISDASYVNVSTDVRGAPYTIALMNGSSFPLIPVPESAARKALAHDGLGMRTGRLDFEVEPVGADARQLASLPTQTRVLSVRILRARVIAGRDRILGDTGGEVRGDAGGTAAADP